MEEIRWGDAEAEWPVKRERGACVHMYVGGMTRKTVMLSPTRQLGAMNLELVWHPRDCLLGALGHRVRLPADDEDIWLVRGRPQADDALVAYFDKVMPDCIRLTDVDVPFTCYFYSDNATTNEWRGVAAMYHVCASFDFVLK